VLNDSSGNEVVLNKHDGCEIKPNNVDKTTTLTFDAPGSEKVEGGVDLSGMSSCMRCPLSNHLAERTFRKCSFYLEYNISRVNVQPPL